MCVECERILETIPPEIFQTMEKYKDELNDLLTKIDNDIGSIVFHPTDQYGNTLEPDQIPEELKELFAHIRKYMMGAYIIPFWLIQPENAENSSPMLGEFIQRGLSDGAAYYHMKHMVKN